MSVLTRLWTRGSQRLILATFLYHSPLYFFKAKSLTEPRSCCWGQAKEPQDMNIAVPLALWLQVTPLCSVPMRVLGSKFKSLWHV